MTSLALPLGSCPAFPLLGAERKSDAQVPPLDRRLSSQPRQRHPLLFTLDPALTDFEQFNSGQASARAPHRLDLPPPGVAARMLRGQLGQGDPRRPWISISVSHEALEHPELYWPKSSDEIPHAVGGDPHSLSQLLNVESGHPLTVRVGLDFKVKVARSDKSRGL